MSKNSCSFAGINHILLLRAVFIIFCCICFSSVSAQKEGNIWYFGDKAGVDFNSGSPVAIHNSVMNTGHGCACISDKCSGQILFYTDGNTVWDNTHNPMPNGTGLLGDQLSTQSAIIVPHPDTLLKEYFIFTVASSGLGGMNYSVVDITLNGGKGDIAPGKKNIPLITPTVEKLTAVKHRNNVDVWVITHQLNSDAFYAYLITTSGINNTPFISHTGSIYDADEIKGYLKASPDGKHLAAAFRNRNSFELYDFDFSTGQVSNAVPFPDNYPGAYGVEFSPDGTKLYTTINSNGLFQYDVEAGSAAAILASEIKLSTVPAVALQLGPDGKIYTNEGRWLGVINAPNLAGLSSNYVPQSVSLGATVFGNSGLPTFLQSYFSPISILEKDLCLGSNTGFSISNLEKIDSLRWNFGEPSSGALNVSTAITPSHQYSNQGTYTVTLIYYGSICGGAVADTITKNITVVPLAPPDADLGADTIICPGNHVILSTVNESSTYRWQDGSTDTVFTAEIAGQYWVEVSNQCGTDRDTIEIINHVSNLQVELGNDTAFCFGNSIVLDVGQSEATYLWSNGSTEPTNFIREQGTYWVKISDKCTSISDTIDVGILRAPSVSLGNRDSTVCPGTVVKLDATSDAANYEWQDGSTESSYEVREDGIYYVNVSNRCGRSRAIIEITYKDCSCTVFAPTAFTPNGDEHNNTFKIAYNCQFLKFELNIFNRWGELVFTTTNPDSYWDGTIGGSSLPVGVYIYHLKYEGVNNNGTLGKDTWGKISMIK